MATMKIRAANAGDVANISSLIRSQCTPFLSSPDGAGAESFFASISEQAIAGYLSAANFSYLVAEDSGAFAGLVAVRDNKHLFHLFVAPEFQGKGLARKLWTEISSAAIANGNPGEFTVNSSLNAVGVYRRFGFETTSEAVQVNGVNFQPMAMIAAINSVAKVNSRQSIALKQKLPNIACVVQYAKHGQT